MINVKKIKEIELTPNLCLAAALSFYSDNFDSDNSKEWSISWLEKNDPELNENVKDKPASLFSNRGFVCRLLDRGFDFGEGIETKLIEFFNGVAKYESPKKETKAPPKRDKTFISRCLDDIDSALDMISCGETPPAILIPPTTMDVKQIVSLCSQTFTELSDEKEIIEDKLNLLNDILERCTGIRQKIKSPRRRAQPKTKTDIAKAKIKAASKANRTMKYLESHDNFKGLKPSDILGKTSVMFLNIKYNTIIVMNAIPGTTFEIVRSNVVNMDENNSYQKRYFKYGEVLRAGDPWKAFDILDKKSSTPTFRVSVNHLIYKVK